jgi:hypothetical protein
MARGRHYRTSRGQSHFRDLCDLLGEEELTNADPKGERYAFGKGGTKTTGGMFAEDVDLLPGKIFGHMLDGAVRAPGEFQALFLVIVRGNAGRRPDRVRAGRLVQWRAVRRRRYIAPR